MTLSTPEGRRVAAALCYLQAKGLLGAIRQRLRRLRQPKYLFGAIVFIGYFALVLGGPMRRAAGAGAGGVAHWPADALTLVSAVAALVVLVWVLLCWLFPDRREALRFSEPEIAFLFPAPISRIGLINFTLLRSQLAIFFSAFLLSLLFGRGRGLPGNALQHATALWLLLAILRLHGLGASFAMSRLVERGGRGWPVRVAVALLVLGFVGTAWWWVVTHVPPPPALGEKNGLRDLVRWALAIRNATPVAIVLAPFELLSAPLVRGGDGWWRALLPALVLLVGHYAWVVRAHLSFEEASIDAARKRAERREAMQSGRWNWWAQRKAKVAPFRLSSHGPVAMAFLWSGLIGSGGGFWRPRYVLLILLGTALGIIGLSVSPFAFWLEQVGTLALMMLVVFGLFGPMMMQRRLRETLDQLDIYKAGPLRGWQIALGQLLTPAAIATFGQWFALFVIALCLMVGSARHIGVAGSWSSIAGVALVGPIFAAVTLCIPFAWILWFPAWAASLGSRGGGFEAAGQRMLFGFAYLLLAAVAIAPAGVLGFLAFMLGSMVGAREALAWVFACAVAAVVLLVELALVLRVLGWRVDRLDVSSELR